MNTITRKSPRQLKLEFFLDAFAPRITYWWSGSEYLSICGHICFPLWVTG
jgi:hypothetical protein